MVVSKVYTNTAIYKIGRDENYSSSKTGSPQKEEEAAF